MVVVLDGNVVVVGNKAKCFSWKALEKICNDNRCRIGSFEIVQALYRRCSVIFGRSVIQLLLPHEIESLQVVAGE